MGGGAPVAGEAAQQRSERRRETNNVTETSTQMRRKQGTTEVDKWREGNDMGMKKKLKKQGEIEFPTILFFYFLFLPLPIS